MRGVALAAAAIGEAGVVMHGRGAGTLAPLGYALPKRRLRAWGAVQFPGCPSRARAP
jgi:hypothetical protein